MNNTATPTETAKAEKNVQVTAYVVLSAYSLEGDHARAGTEVWEEQGNVVARSAQEAIRKAGREGTFVAIPARSWKPVQVTAKVETTLELKPAS